MGAKPVPSGSSWNENKGYDPKIIKGSLKASLFNHLYFPLIMQSALTCLETRVALADDKHLAMTAHNLAVAVARLGGFKG